VGGEFLLRESRVLVPEANGASELVTRINERTQAQRTLRDSTDDYGLDVFTARRLLGALVLPAKLVAQTPPNQQHGDESCANFLAVHVFGVKIFSSGNACKNFALNSALGGSMSIKSALTTIGGTGMAAAIIDKLFLATQGISATQIVGFLSAAELALVGGYMAVVAFTAMATLGYIHCTSQHATDTMYCTTGGSAPSRPISYVLPGACGLACDPGALSAGFDAYWAAMT
jgi:hypothetical protein